MHWPKKVEWKEVREAVGECLKHATQRYDREVKRSRPTTMDEPDAFEPADQTSDDSA